MKILRKNCDSFQVSPAIHDVLSIRVVDKMQNGKVMQARKLMQVSYIEVVRCRRDNKGVPPLMYSVCHAHNATTIEIAPTPLKWARLLVQVLEAKEL